MDILIIVLIVLLIFGLPSWPHSRNWGWSPFGVILVILLVLVLMRYV